MKTAVAVAATVITIGFIAVLAHNTIRQMDAVEESQKQCEYNLHRVLSAGDFKEDNVRTVIMPDSMYDSLFASVAVVLSEEDGLATLETPEGWLFKTEVE